MRLVSQHPPAADLIAYEWADPKRPAGACTSEPPAPDPDKPDLTEQDVLDWESNVLTSGRACRDTLARVCRWHQRGDPTLACPPVSGAGQNN